MARAQGGKRGRARPRRGFTLMEMIIAIAILAIIAVVSWRSLDGIIRSQHAVGDSMADTRALDRLFAQLGYDLAEAVPDAQLGAGAIQFDGAQLRIVRALRQPGQPTRWQVVGYRVADGILWRSLSAPLSSREGARAALDATPAQRQPLLERAASLRIRGWIDPGEN
ncbi:prepilin-type N-terminal cleavage/methylation domain-containing protein, partial [Cupriavidus basilensis]